MSCPFSTSEVFEKIGCYPKKDDIIKCPFIEDCNSSAIWDAISDYIRKGLETYEQAIKDDAVFYSNKPIEDIILETKSEAIKEYVNELKRYMETTEQSDYLDEFNKGNHTYSAMPIYDYVDELAEKLIK